MHIWLRKFTATPKLLAFFGTLLLIVSSPKLAMGQSSNEDDPEGPSFYSSVNGGFGLLYGGFGGSIEGGMGHFAGFGSLGYATKRSIDTLTIAPSVNYHLGVRYYFNVGNEVFFPRVGLGFGWISNYYTEAIASSEYDQNVKGLSLHLGAQFYTFEGLVFNFDVAMSSKFVITAPESHPHFFPFYIRPCIGIGYDLSNLFGEENGSKRIKNKEIDPFGG